MKDRSHGSVPGFVKLTPAIFRPVHLANVRPILDFAVPAVVPYLLKDLKLVEEMQSLAKPRAKGLLGLQYPAQLRELQLPFMQSHILRSTLITAYNLFHGNLNLPLEEFFDVPAVNHLRGHQFKVRQPRFQLARRQVAFAVRVVGPWNRLPPFVAEAPSLNALLGDHLPGFCLIPCNFIYNCTWFWHASAIS